MAFFEQLGKHLADAGQNVAQQTRNLADVTQLNTANSEKEKKISRLFLSIGQLYYEGHRNDPAAECRAVIDEINALYDEIAQNREKIKQIKGVVKCPKCGADVPINAAFCSGCGTKVVQADMQPADDEKIGVVRQCPKCHAAVADDDLFCNSCGTKMNEGGEGQ